MYFDDSEAPITVEELADIEALILLKLPRPLKNMYVIANGGSPNPYVYEDDQLDTVVASVLPIASSSKQTAVNVYEDLVKSKKIVSSHFFPFAIDGGGDYFFIDCMSQDGLVHFYRSDSSDVGSPLISLGIGVEEFFRKLKPE